ncbi:MAG TPA: hypothetical protein VKY74_06045 [Chloroflexia bacterium]|nr:hypothetical protein [Chloroflexia bacterium]
MPRLMQNRRQMLALGVAGLGLLGLLGLLLVAGAPAGGSAAAVAGPRLVAVGLYASRQDAGAPRRQFSASADNEIYVALRWSGLSGMHDAYVHVTSPDGAVYQVLDVPFTSGPAPTGGQPLTRQQPGVLHPVAVQVADTTSGPSLVWGQVPIAGSWMSRLPGPWHLDVTLDGGQTVRGSAKWTLTP